MAEIAISSHSTRCMLWNPPSMKQISAIFTRLAELSRDTLPQGMTSKPKVIIRKFSTR
ncbi:hypothetical protein ANCCAN_02568 [Ancylostoma caninum]|uniref:Uncharacterized protein n=1 Tax=Ancylostoma caninum TaxID=29170 RepID=A0A368H7D4_ANCCA|nr:hypothetical protein ANCCAN_02568 [Ancylostoma caninum]